MQKAKSGDTVQIHYTGWLKDGSEFDSSSGGEPLQFPLGAKKVIDGVDRAVTGMSVGEKKKVEVPADEAYGPHRKELIGDVPRDQFPEDIDLEEGQRLQFTNEQGQVHVFQVLSVADESVKIDMNHPLAGEDLTFEVELVAIEGSAG
jgi:peptidylprolyl isomerase